MSVRNYFPIEVSLEFIFKSWGGGGGGGGGVQQHKGQRTSCDFPGGMIYFVLFCSLFEDIFLNKSGKKNKNKKYEKKIQKT